MEPLQVVFHKKKPTVPLFMVAKILGHGGKKVNAFRIYLYLNARSQGCVVLRNEDFEQIAEDLSLHVRTVKRKLQQLHAWNWVRYDRRTNRYYIRGFRTIAQREGEGSRQGFILDVDEQLSDLEKFKAFIAAAWINNLGRYKVYQYFKQKDIRRGRDEEWLKGRSAPKSRTRLYWWPITATYIAKILGISVSTAHEYRSLAETYGFIEVKRHREEISPELVAYWQNSENEGERKKAQRIRRQNGRLLLDSPVWIRSEVIHYRRIPRLKRKKHSISPPSSLESYSLLKEVKEIPLGVLLPVSA